MSNKIRLSQIDSGDLASYIQYQGVSGAFQFLLGYWGQSGWVGDHVVYRTGNQTIDGIKSFFKNPQVPWATGSGDAVPFSQLALSGTLFVPTGLSGNFYPSYNPSHFATSGSIAIGYYPLQGNPSGFVRNTETGQFVDIFHTGTFYTTDNPADYTAITITGSVAVPTPLDIEALGGIGLFYNQGTQTLYISGAGGGVSLLSVSGAFPAGIADFSGVGGTAVTLIGNKVIISSTGIDFTISGSAPLIGLYNLTGIGGAEIFLSGHNVFISGGAGGAGGGTSQNTFNLLAKSDPYARIVFQTGTAGGPYPSASTWQQRPLSDIIDNLSNIVSLSGYYFVLNSGVYKISAFGEMLSMTNCKNRLYDFTNSKVLLTGLSEYSLNPSIVADQNGPVDGLIYLTGTTALEIQSWGENANTNNYAFGGVTTEGVNDIFTQIEIWQLNTGSLSNVNIISGSGSLLTITGSALCTGNPFDIKGVYGVGVQLSGQKILISGDIPYIKVIYQTTSTDGGAYSGPSAWQTRPLNVITDDTHGLASLASNQIFLPAGIWETDSFGSLIQMSNCQHRLIEASNSMGIITGLADYATLPGSTSVTSACIAPIKGRIYLPTGGAIEIQAIGGGAGGQTYNLGINNGFGYNIFTICEFWKLG